MSHTSIHSNPNKLYPPVQARSHPNRPTSSNYPILFHSTSPNHTPPHLAPWHSIQPLPDPITNIPCLSTLTIPLPPLPSTPLIVVERNLRLTYFNWYNYIRVQTKFWCQTFPLISIEFRSLWLDHWPLWMQCTAPAWDWPHSGMIFYVFLVGDKSRGKMKVVAGEKRRPVSIVLSPDTPPLSPNLSLSKARCKSVPNLMVSQY